MPFPSFFYFFIPSMSIPSFLYIFYFIYAYSFILLHYFFTSLSFITFLSLNLSLLPFIFHLNFLPNKTKLIHKTCTQISELKKKSTAEIASSDNDKAEVLSEFFAEVFTREPDGDMPTVQESQYDNPLQDFNITKEMVLQKLDKLKVDKSPGPDGITARVLRELKDVIGETFTDLFEASVREGQLPMDWKTANVSAIYKRGDKSEACNYRPVSLTCITCKVMESIVRDHLMYHMFTNHLFSDKQYGFIPGRSTTLQLLNAIDDWTKNIEEGIETDVIYMDFQKAFDKVPHHRLLTKLEAYGVKGKALRWINAFLKGRKQRVHVRGNYSSWKDVLSGIPQGSILGPVLFVIYINDMPNCVRSNMLLFADDTKIYRGIQSDSDTTALQEDLSSLQDWSTRWLMPFHPEKCKIMKIHNINKQTRDTLYYLEKEKGENVPVKQTEREKDLGVITDEKLTFEYHIHDKINKANRIIGMI